MYIHGTLYICIIFIKHHLKTTEYFIKSCISLTYILRPVWIIRSSSLAFRKSKDTPFQSVTLYQMKEFACISQTDIPSISRLCVNHSSGFKTCVDVFVLIFSPAFYLCHKICDFLLLSRLVLWGSWESSERYTDKPPLNQTNEIARDAVLGRSSWAWGNPKVILKDTSKEASWEQPLRVESIR